VFGVWCLVFGFWFLVFGKNIKISHEYTTWLKIEVRSFYRFCLYPIDLSYSHNKALKKLQLMNSVFYFKPIQKTGILY